MRVEMISVAQRLVVWSMIGLSGHLLSKVSQARGRVAVATCSVSITTPAYEKVRTPRW
jgi:hypothetical protein